MRDVASSTVPKTTLEHEGSAGRAWTYFLDESGNSGDLALPGERFDFDSQEVFALAAIGLAVPEALDDLVTDLKRRFKVQAPELRYNSVHKKPRFVIELLDRLLALDARILVEVVDKRYFIAAHMIDTLVMPLIPGRSLDPQEAWVRTQFAEYLAKAPTLVFRAFILACQAPSGERIEQAFRAVIAWLADGSHRADVARGILKAVGLGLQEFLDDDPALPETQARWLPAPDPSLTGAPLWILPNLSSFTNLYARINHGHGRRMSIVRLVHDEQRYYEHVLKSGKLAAEGLARQGYGEAFLHADWTFDETATLEFKASSATVGVQLADVIAGFLMWYVRNALYRSSPPNPESRGVFDRLAALSPTTGQGVNFVLSDAAMRRLHLVPVADPWIRPL